MKGIYAQPFSRPKPETEEEAFEAINRAQLRHDEAVTKQEKLRWKPGKQRRDNRVKACSNALDNAKADLLELQSPAEQSLFP